jgi:glutathione synthase/RimK-type ligase-like ATP-grasp enzyme
VRRVAVATCAGENVDPDSPRLLAALADAGLHAELAVWDDPDVSWSNFDAVVVRSTWDYAARRAAFLDWARGVARLENPYEVIAYSTDKHYLRELEQRGIPVVPSTFCDVGSEPQFPDGDFVVKPCVGAGSMLADRYGAHDLARARTHVAQLHAQGRDVLIQPYVDSVDEVGERALIFIDGSFSHAMTKGAMLNVTQLDRNALFRREQMSVAHAEPDALDVADAALRAAGADHLLYARVDLVRANGGWVLMELELAEPSLFLSFHPPAATNLAVALHRRLEASSRA